MEDNRVVTTNAVLLPSWMDDFDEVVWDMRQNPQLYLNEANSEEGILWKRNENDEG